MELAQKIGGWLQPFASKAGAGARYINPHLHILTTSSAGQTHRKVWVRQLREARDAIKDLESKVMDRLGALEEVRSAVLFFERVRNDFENSVSR